jgi:hypothetical protein
VRIAREQAEHMAPDEGVPVAYQHEALTHIKALLAAVETLNIVKESL